MWKKAIKLLSQSIIRSLVLLSWFSIIVNSSIVEARWDDLLEQVFDEPQDYQYASDRDAEDLFDTKIGLWVDLGNIWNDEPVLSIWLNGSIIAKTAQFLLRVTVLLAIPMILYGAIKLMLARWDEGKFKEALRHIAYVALWVFLALMSVWIVYIIVSLTRTNLWNI